MASKASFIRFSDSATLDLDPIRLSLLRPRDFDQGFDFEGPLDQLSIFARHIDTAAPITRLPVFALAEFDLSPASRGLLKGPDQNVRPAFPVVPLGAIGTDHVGYGSFDLQLLRDVRVVEALKMALSAAGLMAKGKPRLTLSLARLIVLPFKDPTIGFDALKEGDLAPDYVTLRMDLDDGMLAGRAVWPPMPSMQTPGVLDCRLSPGSFSMSGALIIGEDGCETLLPGNLASRLVRFRQLIRGPEEAMMARQLRTDTPASTPDFTGRVRLGYAIQYNSEWFPLGHSIGQIAYSLPLAPAEKIKVAVVDWSRRDVAKRIEQTTEAEDLEHAALRDRSLSESVHMVVRESQSGSSFMAGGALSAGAGIPLGAVSLGIGAAFAIGGASSNSQGIRTVVADTTQTISDAFHQASSALRELNSTVVVQGEQAEKSEARTRVVVNYNHSHALTILYYEVLQHHRIVTRPTSVRPVLFLKYEAGFFGGVEDDATYELIEKHRGVIAANLLDESLRGCLETVVKRQCRKHNLERQKERRKSLGDPLDDLMVGDMTVTVRSGATAANLNVMIDLETVGGGQKIPCHFEPHLRARQAAPFPKGDGSDPPPQVFPEIFSNFAGLGTPILKPNTEFIFLIKPSIGVRWKNVAAIGISQTASPTPPSATWGPWIIEDFRATTASPSGQWVMKSGKPSPNVVPANGRLRIPVQGFTPPTENVDDLLDDEERCCLRRLVGHLNDHRGHYWAAAWRAENRADRAVRLDPWTFDGVPLLDLVDNELIEFAGEYAVMPAAGASERRIFQAFGMREPGDLRPPNQAVEQILTLPVRGVFAEAKLGHCNASEPIDPTRFWDWQQSPIPDDAPDIAAVSTDSRAQDPSKGLAPTPFPAAMVNIVSPQALPDPAGLQTAAAVMSALGPFRDMSGIKELGPLLQTLSNNATQLASQGLKNAQTPAMMNAIRSAQELPVETRAKLIEELLTGQVKPPAPAAGPGGGTAPAPVPPSVTPVSPAPQPAPQPIPPPSKPPSSVSPKMKRIELSFTYQGGEVMMGSWEVTLISGLSEKRQRHMENTVLGASNVSVGNRMVLDVPADFGGSEPVTIQISGMIVGPPETVSTGTRRYETRAWSAPRVFSKAFSRADFTKTRLYRVTQPTDAVEFSMKRTVLDKSGSTTTHGESAGLTVGVENSIEAGGSIGVAEAKDSIKITAQGTYGWTGSQQEMKEVTGGYEEDVKFVGRRISPLPPLIEPL